MLRYRKNYQNAYHFCITYFITLRLLLRYLNVFDKIAYIICTEMGMVSWAMYWDMYHMYHIMATLYHSILKRKSCFLYISKCNLNPYILYVYKYMNIRYIYNFSILGLNISWQMHLHQGSSLWNQYQHFSLLIYGISKKIFTWLCWYLACRGYVDSWV